jgi:hypothetical protein
MAYYAEGLYQTEIVDQGFTTKNTRDGDVIVFWFSVEVQDSITLDGDNKVYEPVPKKYERNVELWFSDKSKKYSIEHLRNLGYNGDDFRDLEPGGSFSLKGQKVVLMCETSKCGNYDNFRFPSSGGSGKTPEAKANAGRDLNALFGADLKSAAKKAAPKLEPKPQADTSTGESATPAVDNDDVPF